MMAQPSQALGDAPKEVDGIGYQESATTPSQASEAPHLGRIMWMKGSPQEGIGRAA